MADHIDPIKYWADRKDDPPDLDALGVPKGQEYKISWLIELEEGIGIQGPYAAHPLPGMLALAVPLKIMDLEHYSPEARWDLTKRWAQEAQDVMLEIGESIIYKSNKKGDSARGFVAILRVVAALAYMPGGISLFGQRYIAGADNIKQWQDLKAEGKEASSGG